MRENSAGTAHRVHLLRQPRYADPALEKRCAAGLIFRHAPIGVGEAAVGEAALISDQRKSPAKTVGGTSMSVRGEGFR